MNIRISKFDTNTTNEDLKKLFQPFGEVASANVEIDSFSETSRGFGFLEMPNEEEARNAISSLNNTDFNGKQIAVQVAELKEEKKGSYKVGSGGINPYRFKKN